MGLRLSVDTTGPKTFGQVATELMDGLESGWRNAKHRQQWRNTLETYAKTLWDMPVSDITVDDVVAVLKPIWSVKDETASRARVRGRIERVLDAAKARGMIAAADVLVRRCEVERFEAQHGINDGRAADGRRRGGPGVPPRHDWDGFYGALARRIHEHGIPATQAELVREMLSWFESRSDKEPPDESTVRRKITAVWRELHRV